MIRNFASQLASLEIWLAGAALLGSLVWVRTLPLTVGIMLLFWPIRWLAYGKPGLRTQADLPVVLLLLMIPVTIWVSSLPLTTRLQVYRLLSGVGLYYAVVNWTRTGSRLRLMVLGVALAGIGLSILGLFSVQWTTSKLPFIPTTIYEFLPTLGSDLIHKNVMAGSLVYLLPVVLGILIFTWGALGRLERLTFSVAALIMGSVLVLTQSRGALLAFGCVLLVLIVLRWPRGWLIVIGVLFIGGLFSYGYGTSDILEIITHNDSIQGIDVRVEIWSRAIYMIQDFPLSGIGMGSYGEIADRLYPFLLAEPGSIPHAHNLFLQVGVDLGIPGLIAWLAVLLTVIVVYLKMYRYGRESQDFWITALGAGFFASQVGLIVHGITDAVTWGMIRPAPIVWAIWGLGIASWNIYGGPPVENTSP